MAGSLQSITVETRVMWLECLSCQETEQQNILVLMGFYATDDSESLWKFKYKVLVRDKLADSI